MKNSFIIVLLVVCCTSFAQRPNKELNFNSIPHKGVKDTTIFVAALDGPMWISDVKSSCSCVKVKFSKKIVMARDSVGIYIHFSADDKGVFYKTLKVTCSDVRLNHEIVVRGKVR